jgi:hypothetical protein
MASEGKNENRNSEPAPGVASPDPELSAIPKPRRPWRTATLVSLTITGVLALALIFALRSHVAYALQSGPPTELGELESYRPAQTAANTWVHGSGMLSNRAVGYRRPLDSDRFRLAPIEGNDDLWVELREPGESRGEFFVAPTSFVGRLVPLSSPGLRHSDLLRALEHSKQITPSAGAWLLIDGSAPTTSRWVLGLVAMLLLFVGFSVWGMVTLLRPAAASKG